MDPTQDYGPAYALLANATLATWGNVTSGNNSDNCTDPEFCFEDYDADAPIPWGEFSVVAIFYLSTLICGVVGNALVIVSITRYRRMRSVTNCFLVSLASADLLLILVCVPIKFAKWFSHTWNFGEFMCKFVHYIQNVSVICSVLTLTMMSLERYYAILHPMRAKYMCTVKQARRVIIAVWILSFILATPILYGQDHIQVGYPKFVGLYWCIKEFSQNTLHHLLYEIYLFLLVLVIPVIIMSFAYASICVELWVMTKKRAHITGGRMQSDSLNGDFRRDDSSRSKRQKSKAVDDDRTRKQVIKMLVTVIVLFVICWAPRLIDQLLVACQVLEIESIGSLKYMRMVFSLMSYFNSCINPIVYAFMSKNFRDMFRHAFRSGFCPRSRPILRGASFQTRSTSLSFSRTATTKADMEIDSLGPMSTTTTEYKDLPV